MENDEIFKVSNSLLIKINSKLPYEKLLHIELASTVESKAATPSTTGSTS